MSGWYYAKDGQQCGPVEKEALVSMVKNGEVGPDTLVWRGGMGDVWKKLADIPEFAPPDTAGSTEPQPVNVFATYNARFAGQAGGPGEGDKEKQRRSSSLGSFIGKFVKLAIVLAAVFGVFMAWKHFFYVSPAAKVYEEFAQAKFEVRFEDAMKLCAPGQACDEMKKLVEMVAELKKPRTGLAAALAPAVPTCPEIRSKKYKVLEEKKGADGNTVNLKVEQAEKILIDYSPYQMTLVAIHTATMVKDGDSWKVLSYSSERDGNYSAFGQKLY